MLCISSNLAIALQPFGHPTVGVGKAIAFVFDKSKFAKFLYLDFLHESMSFHPKSLSQTWEKGSGDVAHFPQGGRILHLCSRLLNSGSRLLNSGSRL
ncbi:hypothetical protein, partial [Nostoc sp. ChiVER01]|uniref:hypothetical protein n=1 Tax=Nostoc sp. ChiVER01 TaxID=3075382 RepID=UPI002AD25225